MTIGHFSLSVFITRTVIFSMPAEELWTAVALFALAVAVPKELAKKASDSPTNTRTFCDGSIGAGGGCLSAAIAANASAKSDRPGFTMHRLLRASSYWRCF